MTSHQWARCETFTYRGLVQELEQCEVCGAARVKRQYPWETDQRVYFAGEGILPAVAEQCPGAGHKLSAEGALMTEGGVGDA